MNRDQRPAAWLEGELDADGHEELLRDLSSDESYAREAAAQLQMKRLLGSQVLISVRWPSEARRFIKNNCDGLGKQPFRGRRVPFRRAWKPNVRIWLTPPPWNDP